MKNLKVLILMVFSIFILVSCGGGDSKVKTIDFIISDDSLEGGAMAKAVERYNNSQDEIKINLIELPYDSVRAKVKTMVAGGKAPALMRTSNIDEFETVLADLSDTVNPADFTDKMEENLMDGKFLGVPLNLTVNGLIYNKTLFDKAGVKVPDSQDNIWTWDEFVQALNTVKEKNSLKYGMIMDFSQNRYQTMLYQFGGRIFDENGDIVVDQPDSIRTLDYFIKLHKDKVMPDDVWLGGEDASNLFKTGTIPAYYSGSWKINEYKNDIKDFEWGIAYMPKEKNRSSIAGGNFLVAFTKSPDLEEAKKFIKWFYQDENYKQYCEDGAYISGKLSVHPSYAYGQEFFDILDNEIVNTPELSPNDKKMIKKYKAAGNMMRDYIVYAIQGERTPVQAMTELKEKWSELKK